MSRTAGTYVQGPGPRYMDVALTPAELKSGAINRRLNVLAYPRLGVTMFVDAPATLAVTPAGSQLAATVLTLTATVTASETGSGTVEGSVEFKNGAASLATVAVAAGSASTTTTLAIGSHTLTAVFTPSATSPYGPNTSAGVARTST